MRLVCVGQSVELRRHTRHGLQPQVCERRQAGPAAGPGRHRGGLLKQAAGEAGECEERC